MRNVAFEEPPPMSVTLGLTALRLITGTVIAAHGWRELSDLRGWQATLSQLGVPSAEMAAPLSVGAALLLALALTLGWFTRLSALGLLCVALVAIAGLQMHGLFARDGAFEYPLVLAGISIALFFTGGGRRLSLDRVLLDRARRRAILSDERWQLPPYVAAPTNTRARPDWQGAGVDARGRQ
jgi:putative oxidoreductase